MSVRSVYFSHRHVGTYIPVVRHPLSTYIRTLFVVCFGFGPATDCYLRRLVLEILIAAGGGTLSSLARSKPRPQLYIRSPMPYKP